MRLEGLLVGAYLNIDYDEWALSLAVIPLPLQLP